MPAAKKGKPKPELWQPGCVVRSLRGCFRDKRDPAAVALMQRLPLAVRVFVGKWDNWFGWP